MIAPVVPAETTDQANAGPTAAPVARPPDWPSTVRTAPPPDRPDLDSKDTDWNRSRVRAYRRLRVGPFPHGALPSV